MTAASNAIGTRPDVAAIAAVAHAAGALCYVDGVHATPHMPVDVSALGADFYATSAYKWSGPHVAAVVAGPALLETLWPDKLAPSSDEVPAGSSAARCRSPTWRGWPRRSSTWPSLAPGAAPPAGRRRERVLASMAAVEEYETALFARLLDGLGAMSHVTLYGKAARRAPTAFFTVAGLAPRAVAVHAGRARRQRVGRRQLRLRAVRCSGLEPDGAVRAGLVHYNDASDVDRLLAGVGELAG